MTPNERRYYTTHGKISDLGERTAVVTSQGRLVAVDV